MTGRSPVGPLMAEHRLIERMLVVLKTGLDSMVDHGRADTAFIDVATDFIRTYADRCHHGKEEDILFDRLASKELDAGFAALMAELVDDHVHGRAMTHRLVTANNKYRAGDMSALPEIESCVQELVDFYPAHIQKEDRHFFKPAMQLFTDPEQATMLADFEQFDRALIQEKYRGIVEELERSLV